MEVIEAQRINLETVMDTVPRGMHMRVLIGVAVVLVLVLACEPETPSPSEPTPVFDPVYQASMIDFLEQEIVKAKQYGNDALVECLTLMQAAYIRGQPMDDDEEERCQPVLGTYSSQTAQPP